ncbi:MAG: hypothetical protein EPN33_08065 [Acidobacteria bacterium]|nr:MAG: hypothetical protein EPN33_08065 [Acidobacteriota bacterium]
MQSSRPGVYLPALLAVALLVALRPAAAQAQERDHHDDPTARAAWFLRGRRSPDPRPAAAHLRQAFVARRQVRLAPRPAAGATPDLAGFNPTGSGTWKELGPRPQATSGSLLGGLPSEDDGDISGRVSAVAIAPSDSSGNTVYIGGAFGGLWKSTNAMSSSPVFTPLTDNQPTLAVGAIGLDPSDSKTIFIGTGEPNSAGDSYYGDGILESTDGGTTWTDVTTAGSRTLLGLGFSRIIFDVASPSIVLAAASNHTCCDSGESAGSAGIYRSTDHGATWSVVFSVPAPTDGSVTDLVYDAGSKTYYAAVSQAGIYKSTDQGQTWAAVGSPFAAGIAASDVVGTTVEFYRGSLAVRGSVVYALIADSTGRPATPTACTSANSPNCDTGLVQSSDGGSTWTAVPMPDVSAAAGQFSNLYCEPGSCQGFYDQDLAAPAGGTGLIAGGLDLWSTTTIPAMTSNGVSTAWTDLTNSYGTQVNEVHSDQHAIAVLNATTWVVGNDGGAWATTAAGASWQNLNATVGNIQFHSVAPDQQATGVWIGGSQDNGTQKLTGPGMTWTRYEEGDGGFTATNPSNAQQYFSEFYGISVVRSDDAGSDPNNGPMPVVNSSVITDSIFDFYVPYLLMPKPKNGLLLLGTCRVWAGPDGNTSAPVFGASGWFPYSNDLTTGNSACTTPWDYITGLAASASNPDVAWAVTEDAQVQMTTNLTSATPSAPARWTDVAAAPLPNAQSFIPLSSVAINPIDPNIVYVSAQGFGGGHVFKTTNAGQSWTDISGNLPDAPANWVLIDPLGPNNDIYVATDVGVFVATDGGIAGEQWEQVGGGLPDAAVLQLALSPAAWSGSRELAAATHGRGMWEIAPVPTPDFTLAANPATQEVVTGTAATFAVTATGENGEAGPITYACTAPASGCSVAPKSAAAGSPVTVTLATTAVAAGANTITLSGTNEAGVTHTISATVTGTGGFSLAITPAQPTVVAGSPATLTVTAQAGTGFSGSVALACTAPSTGCTVSPSSVAVGATATVTVAAAQLKDGANTVTLTGTSGAITATQTVTVTVQDFALAAGTSTASISPGQSATYTLTLSASNGFSGSVALACSGAPTDATCAIAPTPVTPTASGASATVTVTTTAASEIAPGNWPFDGGGLWFYLLLLLAAGLTGSCLLAWQQNHRTWVPRLLGGAVLSCLLLAVACGGGGGSAPPLPAPPSHPGIAAGSYTLTVTGTSGTASHSQALTLTVQ